MSHISSGEGIGLISIDLGVHGLGVPEAHWRSCVKAVEQYKSLRGCTVDVGTDGWLRVMTKLHPNKEGDALAKALENLENMITRTCRARVKAAA